MRIRAVSHAGDRPVDFFTGVQVLAAQGVSEDELDAELAERLAEAERQAVSDEGVSACSCCPHRLSLERCAPQTPPQPPPLPLLLLRPRRAHSQDRHPACSPPHMRTLLQPPWLF